MKSLPFVQINSDSCIRCGACVRDCLAGILAFPDSQDFASGSAGTDVPRFIAGAAARCFRCQHCFAICPTGAFSFSGRKSEESLPMGELPKPKQVVALLRQRRSIRNYRRENVSPEILAELRSAMDFVPTGCNDHRLHFIWSSSLSVTDSFRNGVSTWLQKQVRDNTLPAPLTRFSVFIPALKAGKDVFFRNAPHFVAISVPPDAKDAHIDPFIAASQLEILAVSFGLGTCWGGMATDLFNGSDELYAKLSIPAGYDLKIILLFGVPAVTYARLPQPEPCVHQELSAPTCAAIEASSLRLETS